MHTIIIQLTKAGFVVKLNFLRGTAISGTLGLIIDDKGFRWRTKKVVAQPGSIAVIDFSDSIINYKEVNVS
ncbi:MAG: hypothetical protein GY850_46410 [bacterium]|nr:hypothetical protein [bacterium]